MTDHEWPLGAEPRSVFDAALAGDDRVRDAVVAHFGYAADAVLSAMQDGTVVSEHADELNGLLVDLLAEKGEMVSSFEGRGDFGPFPITIIQFGPIFWIAADEFDDIGFFGDLVTASEAAAANYEPFITAAVEHADEE